MSPTQLILPSVWMLSSFESALSGAIRRWTNRLLHSFSRSTAVCSPIQEMLRLSSWDAAASDAAVETDSGALWGCLSDRWQQYWSRILERFAVVSPTDGSSTGCVDTCWPPCHLQSQCFLSSLSSRLHDFLTCVYACRKLRLTS